MKFKINLEILKRTRKTPKPGDVFVFKLKQENFYRFGKLIRDDTSIGNFENVLMIYIYKARSKHKNKIPNLDHNKLLLPPLGLTNQLWTQGLVENIGFEKVTKENTLQPNVFRNPGRIDIPFCDEDGNPVKNPIEPIGLYAEGNVRTFDNKISRRLGYPEYF